MVALLASVLVFLLQILGVVLFVMAVYHYLFVVASAMRARPVARTVQWRRRFALVIPAHNEEAVITRTLERAFELDYPPDQYDVIVIADHCADQTAHLAAEAGAIVCVRDEEPSGRKGYALAWGFDRLMATSPAYDAFVILDADSLVDGQFLNVAAAGLDASQGVLQGQRIVSNAGDSMLATIAAVDQRLNNRLRNQARSNLGLACRLMGDAMVFARDILTANPWDSDSLVEDREYGARLLLKGIRARYLPEAITRQQAAVTWTSGRQQRLRWYRGAVEVQRRLALSLLSEGVRQRDWAKLDGGVELIMPAYSTLTALTLVVAVIQGLMLPQSGAGFFALTGAALLAWLAYPVLGLWIDRAPASMYKALLYGPLYLMWRVWLAVLTRVLGRRIQWVRTQRREEIQ